MSEPPRVLVPLNDSDSAKLALPAAKRLAKAAGGAEIELLHVAENDLVDEDGLRRKLDLPEAEVAGIRLLQTRGNPADEICRIAVERSIWIIVMSLQSKTAHRERRLGSTTEVVIRNTDRAISTFRPDMIEARRTLGRISRVLLPLDGSPAAAAAVRAVVDLARRFTARLDLLHVPQSGRNPPPHRGTLAGPRYLDSHHHEWQSWAEEFMRRFGPETAGAVELAELHAAPGDPAEQILRFAVEREVDLIGIAWRQSLNPGRAETVKRLLAESPCPLLFVPARQAEGR